MKESLSPYIDSFLTMIAVEKGLAKNTVEATAATWCDYQNFWSARASHPGKTQKAFISVPTYHHAAQRTEPVP
jgi:site-specific recombinase XerD